MFRRIAVILLTLSLFGCLSVNADSYYYNRKGESVKVPDAYKAGEILYGESLEIGSFNGISDRYTAEDGKLFIADTGNNRVVILNPDNTLFRVIYKLNGQNEEHSLSEPQGVFFKDGKIYICNTGAGEILVADENGNIVLILNKPDSASISENADFKPSKIAVNSAGSIFVQASGIYQGLLQYGPEGEFINFFGATKVEVTPAVVIQNMWKSLFSDEQREGLERIISNELSNVFIDSEDFIFTVTSSVNSKQVRKLNAAGENILTYPGYSESAVFTSGYDKNNFGDQETDYSKGKLVVSEIRDVHIDSDGILSVLDAARGKIFQYDDELTPICIFGGTGEQAGYFRKAAALEKRGNEYIIADSSKNTITFMSPTQYIIDIRNALKLYRRGDYTGTVEQWQKILNLNPSFTIAYKSIGRALLQEGKSGEALEYLREGDDRYYYSLAVQEYRREFFRENWQWLIPAVLAAVTASAYGIHRLKKWLKSPVRRNDSA